MAVRKDLGVALEMSYVIGAQVAVAALFAGHVWTLVARQRVIAEFRDAAELPVTELTRGRR